ncbi:Acg family FMN-binding oxidoreductase [Streptomyces sp. LN549]|uniref:Acg family FMN-binding oxidoreductase n=1 Tax=Streptomyces sp. LN549 TaxID=3112979 RepID=UPI00371EC26A
MSTTERDVTVVTSLVEDAVTAPSMHNTQPWKFVYSTDTRVLAVYGDPVRTLPAGDPDNRGLHLGCGAALFNLRVAAAHHGWSAVANLLPSSLDYWHLADVPLREAGAPEGELAALHPAVRQRHTSRFPFSDDRIPAGVMDGLCAAALLEGCRLTVPAAWHMDTVMELVHDAELFETASGAMRDEIAAWTRTGRSKERSTDGIPGYALGPRDSGVTAPTRDFDTQRSVRDRAATPFEKRPQIALLGTVTDTPADWLRAGQAMQRVLLQATLDGLATSMLSQPLEWPELRSFARDPGSATGFVHMLLRLGYGPRGTATPRRRVDEVLTIR